jgi:hypothetical protein
MVRLARSRPWSTVDDVVLLKTPLAPLAVSLAGVLTDPRHRALGRDRLLEDFLQSRLCAHIVVFTVLGSWPLR